MGNTSARRGVSVAAVAAAALFLGGARAVPAYVEHGRASWYGPGFHGRPTASGERFDQDALTAAHPGLPLGTVKVVTNVGNGRSVEVEINDRGPYVAGRIIDLSRAAADEIGMVEAGTAPVVVEVGRFELARADARARWPPRAGGAAGSGGPRIE